MTGLDREVIRWLQHLDLSFIVKNPKRDLTNGWLVAEILSRYYPKDINMLSYDKGTRLATKIDNWEQLFKVFQKHNLPFNKHEFDGVIHCKAGSGTMFLYKLYSVLTERQVKMFQPGDNKPPDPAFMRPTASLILKDHEIHRIQDDLHRTLVAIDVLGSYHDHRRTVRAMEGPALVYRQRQDQTAKTQNAADTKEQVEGLETHKVDEVQVKSLQREVTDIRGQKGLDQQTAHQRSKIIELMNANRSAVGAMATMHLSAPFVKPAADIMKPLVIGILQESPELAAQVEQRKDAVAAFVEFCRDMVPEELSVRVFETLANRAQLLVDTLIKSPSEFWKVWSLLFPALVDFNESSSVFESVVFLFKRLGDLMREADPSLTQQLVTEVGLPSLAKELAASPEKRDALCEILYSYVQEDTLNHLLVLRALKEKTKDLGVYQCCLSCLITLDAQLGLLDENLLDLYIYYALLAMQNVQPRIRVAGLCILSTITVNSPQFESVLALTTSFGGLVTDDWWEVQSQLLLLAAQLLQRVASSPDLHEIASATTGDDGESKPDAPGIKERRYSENTEALLAVVARVFSIHNSKNVLQVGLSALAPVIGEFPTLLPLYVTNLLCQTAALRQRLLRPKDQDEGVGAPTERLTYVMGTSSRLYEECRIAEIWPHVEVAKTFAAQVESSPLDHFELEHMEVLNAALPAILGELFTQEWLGVFSRVKNYVFVALIDPDLHVHATEVLRKFWLSDVERIATESLEASRKTLLQVLRIFYSDVDRTKVNEQDLLEFLRDISSQGGAAAIEIKGVIESFKEVHSAEYESSGLNAIIG
jgi:hypothetical protein